MPDHQDLFENAPCGYLVIDARGGVVLANRTLRTWLGDEAIVGKRLHDLMPIAGRMFYETHFAPLLRMQGFFHEVALDFVCTDGSRLPVLANATQTVKDNEILETRIAVFRATSRRKYERELAHAKRAADEAKAKLEEVNRALAETGRLREEFVAILGHDLRNPLASIASGMRMLSKEDLSDRGRQVACLVDGSVTRMESLIDDILDLAQGRLGSGLVVARRREEALHHHLEQVVAELSTALGRPITTSLELSEPAFVDAARIAQLVSNLLANAMYHGAQDMPVELSASIKDKHLTIAVSNGGGPIPPETIERLFQPFFRGGGAKDSRHGLGLGLHIASEIAKAHGGTLTVTSDPESTTFEFRMRNDPPQPGDRRSNP